MSFYTSELSDAMNARERATDALRALTQRGIKTDADRSKEDALLSDIARYDRQVHELVNLGAAVEFSRDNGVNFRFPTDGTQRRELGDAKLFGVRLADLGKDTWTTRAADTPADTHGHEFADVMLSAAPNGSKLLSKVQTFPFTRTRGFVPVAPVVNAQLQPRNAALVNGTTSVTISALETVKPAAYVVIDRDELSEYPFAEKSIDAALLGAVGRAADSVIVSGGSDGDITVPGLLDAGVTTAATTVGKVTVADVFKAVGRIEDAHGNASALIMSPASRAQFMADNASNGAILKELPEIVTIAGGAIANGAFVVADLAQVGVALRQDIELYKSIDEPTLWGYDKVALAARARLSGVSLANTAHVQIVA